MRALPHLSLLAAVILSGGLLAGCAQKPPADDPEAVAEFNETNDPLEPTNRVFYAVNNGLDTVILRPLALGYRYVVPEVVRTHTRNVLSNISSPVTLFNDMLQARPRRAGDTLMRFLVNTTAGVGGVFDVATDWGWPAHDSDAGMTLAMWGLPEGPFLFLPVLGPSSPRDATGFGADLVMDPTFWVGRGDVVTALGWTRFSLNAIDTRASVLDDLDKIKAQALDPYATFRSLYRQHRQSQIEDARADERATVPAWFQQPSKQ
ncbi:VacJ family lipoprotein [Rhodovastum atsumiense]|nr:VacJ family lipoprotein [Rhodovastum atsumiense]CAH2599504.1 VacJ family lipoprotein [Rhodovastum atsumiense]